MRIAIGAEFACIVMCLFAITASATVGLRSALMRRFVPAASAMIGIIAGVYFLKLGFGHGAALLYAT